MPKLFTIARKYGSKAAVAVTGLALSALSYAQTGPMDAFFDEVDLGGIVTKVTAAGLVIVGIALVFKGPDLAKRIVRKV